MKTLKENFFGNLGIGKVAKIEEWLKKYNIKNYTINPDFTIDVNGNVYINKYPEKKLPDYIQFNKVEGQFNVSVSNITSLKGAPKECEDFDCSHCKNLTSLEGAPIKCEGFYCYNCKGNFTEEDVLKVCSAKIIF